MSFHGWRALCARLGLLASLAGSPLALAAPTSSAAEPAARPAPMVLLTRAQALANAGKPAEAAATLERAIRIEPRNPWLWHRLAVLRLQEGQHSLAVELAKKSNVLARGNRRLVAGNWLLIGKARAGLRDAEGAARARARARGYLRRGGP
ncbi:MAG: tetratricopeptide repeat protein [Gammaproteobacteria bacterium]|nr:tetratricopeptide repeat protein [Gammaproteobacteria bacterium]